jgi:hypothetical protein
MAPPEVVSTVPCPTHQVPDTFHSERFPHWSESIEWRAGRWDPITNAPMGGYPILKVRGRDAKGNILEPIHFAEGGGEEQPPFRGWFVPYGDGRSGFYQVRPIEWQPLRASPIEEVR